MSSQKFAIPFRVHLKRSFILSALLLFLYGGATVCVLLLAWPWWLKLGAGVMLALSLVNVLKRHILLSGHGAVVSLCCDDGERWRLQSASGEWSEAALVSGTSMQPWLVVLNFRIEGRRRLLPVVVMSDSTDSTTFRRLNVRLRRAAPVPV